MKSEGRWKRESNCTARSPLELTQLQPLYKEVLAREAPLSTKRTFQQLHCEELHVRCNLLCHELGNRRGWGKMWAGRWGGVCNGPQYRDSSSLMYVHQLSMGTCRRTAHRCITPNTAYPLCYTPTSYSCQTVNLLYTFTHGCIMCICTCICAYICMHVCLLYVHFCIHVHTNAPVGHGLTFWAFG